MLENQSRNQTKEQHKTTEAQWACFSRQLRHDFLNCLQILSTMVQLGKDEHQITDYIREISFSFSSLGKLNLVPDGAVGAYLSSMILSLITAEYKVKVDVSSNIQRCGTITDIGKECVNSIVDQLCEIASFTPGDDKVMDIAIGCENGCYVFTLSMPYYTLDDSYVAKLEKLLGGSNNEFSIHEDTGLSIKCALS